VYTISKARALGDALVVSVARDNTIRKRKKREPLIGEGDRVRLLSSLREVDAAILGVEGDIYVTLQKIAPDIVALGYDQYHMEGDVKREAEKRGMKLKVVRLDSPYPHIKTTKILQEL
jgi:glycerol-3-phosphate cytidylyltransferase-like family protein